MLPEKIQLPVLLRLCLLSIFINGHAMAQDTPPFKKGTDTDAIMQLLRTAILIHNLDSGIKTFKLAAQKSVENDFNYGAAESFLQIAGRYENLGNYPEALAYSRQALPYAERAGNKKQIASCHNFFGLLHFFDGNYVQASEEYIKALKVLGNADKKNIDQAVAIYTNLAHISMLSGEKDMAIYYLNKAELLARSSTGDSSMAAINIATVFGNKGSYYGDVNMPDSAIKYFTEILSIVKRIGPEKANARLYYEGTADNNLGEFFVQTGEYEKAVYYSRRAISLTSDKYVYIAEAAAYTLGDALFHLKKYKEAETTIAGQLGKNAAGNHKDATVKGYEIMAKIYKATKQYQKAVDYLDTLFTLKDTLMTAEKVKAISQMDSKYKMAEKDAQITKNELLIAQQKNKITQKNIWIGSISAGVLLLFALSIGLDRNNRRKQAGEIRALKQENTISILKGVVQGEENERIRLARDLHDGIGGMLSATKMRFMALRHENEHLVSSPRYLEAMGLLDIMGDEIRKTSHNLMPEVLLKQNLADALRTYCNNIQAGADMHIDFQSFGNFDDLPNDFKLNIYRIVQELLKNTQQHAKATYAVVQLMMLEAYLTISVEDNGIGFDTNKTKDGIGLHNLKTRVLSHEGHYTLKSEPGKGTTVYIEFGMPTPEPLPMKKSGQVPGNNQFS